MDIKNQFSLRAPALFILPGMIGGLLLAGTVSAKPFVLVGALALAILSWGLSKQEKSALWFASFTASCILGFWAYGTLRLPSAPGTETLSLPPREARLELKIERVMQSEGRFGRSTGIARIVDAPLTSRLRDNSQIYFRLSKDDTAALPIMRGITIQATGVVYPIPDDVSVDSFEAYLKETGTHYRFEQTSGAIVTQKASAFNRLCHHTNLRFQNYLHLGETHGGNLSKIYIAMLLGQKTQLSSDQRDRFQATGTMHLFAISGLHIGVIATVIWQLLLLLRIPPKITPILGLPLLYFYVEVTGATPSAIRAFLMVAFFWASILVQRQRSPLSALAGSAILVLIIQPLQLWQMGFQLSYLVVISILMFGLPLHKKCWAVLRPNKYLPEADWNRFQKAYYWGADKCTMLLAISFSAWLASAPLSAGFFGYLSPYAILANVLLVNLAALVISGGVISLVVASCGLECIAAFLNHSAWLGISLMDSIVRLNVELPGATIQYQHFPTAISYLGVLVYLSSIIVLGNARNELLRFSVPPLAVCLTLGIGILAGGQ